MKIFTITCHDVYNYGASLQAYALQAYLLSLGHECRIIDYKPDYLRRNYNFWYIERNSRFYELCNKSIIFHFLYSLRLAPLTFKTWRRIKPFERFKHTNLLCTKCYTSLDELQKTPPIGDVYIAGSDQIWNCSLSNGKDNAFFLGFGPNDTRRIAYAASMGISYFPEDEIERIKKLLSYFEYISVRESSAQKVIEQLGFPCATVCDPIFLLNRDKWDNIIPCIASKERYVLLYDIFADDISIREAALKISSELGIPIYSINDSKKCNYAHKNISNAGPVDFLWYIINADFVISNSFHATAFSVLFNKNFATFYHKTNSSRITDLLDFLGLSEHHNPKDLVKVKNWSSVNDRLNEFISYSKNFINIALA